MAPSGPRPRFLKMMCVCFPQRSSRPFRRVQTDLRRVRLASATPLPSSPLMWAGVRVPSVSLSGYPLLNSVMLAA